MALDRKNETNMNMQPGINKNEQIIVKTKISQFLSGVMVNVNHPNEWPSSGRYVAAGMMINLNIKPTAFSTSDDVSGLSPEDRQCNYYVSW